MYLIASISSKSILIVYNLDLSCGWRAIFLSSTNLFYSETSIFFTNMRAFIFLSLFAYCSAWERVTLVYENCKTITGVLIFSLPVIKISLNLGIPRVRFTPPCPARWKVLRVI